MCNNKKIIVKTFLILTGIILIVDTDQSVIQAMKLMNDTDLSTSYGSMNHKQNIINDNDEDDYDYEDDDDGYENVGSKYKILPPETSHQRSVRSPNGYYYKNKTEDDYQSDQPIGLLTNFKEQQLGVPAEVQAKLNFMRELKERNIKLKEMATNNQNEVYRLANCKVPSMQLIYLSHMSKNYEPRAAMLHRCSSTTGCCIDPTKICEAKTIETVELAFWESKSNVESKSIPILKRFENHTECHCVSSSKQRRKRNYMPCQCPEYFTNFGTQNDYQVDQVPNFASTRSCRCDCHLSNPICQRLKNGEEGFSMSERKCISSNKCSQPICNYGVYNIQKGRCPSPESMRQQRGHRGPG
ncbi:uncharacterized protein Pvf2 [Drosophila tropicalis]|uniref:uncharacterized protein Pvf2 n=1 Tax=Drosophila tropicalis TaxID=46794 RepID=UPI0035AB83A4